MPTYNEGGLTFYLYGDDDAPAGAGKGAQDYKTLSKECSPENKFIDPLFLPNSDTLAGLDLTDSEGEPLDIKWCRPKEIAAELFGKDPIFNGPYDEFGVNQGSVGDCWFLAVLADVARMPECINTLIPTDNTTSGFDNGIFHFRFWCRGKWIDVVVDDLLPCIMINEKVDQTALCKPTENGGFWAPLLEKAYSKLYGGYNKLDGGFMLDAMKDFTGGFIISYQAGDEEKVDWKKVIKESTDTDSIMSIGMIGECPKEHLVPHDPNNPGQEGVSDEGIVCGHAYSLLDIKDVTDINDSTKTYTLVKLRNPWGNATEWKGKFNDNDPIWDAVTPNYRKNAIDRKDDGEFWMPIDDMERYLDSLDTCRWSGAFRGDEAAQNMPGAMYLQLSDNFTTKNWFTVQGEANELRGKPGYYVHLKMVDPEGETKEDGYTYNCGIYINLLYKNYTQSGGSPGIPPYGFYLLWAPGEQLPEGDFFDNVKYVKFPGNEEPGGSRDVNIAVDLPAGTAFIVPWIGSEPTEPTPYLLRIFAEGEIHPYLQ